jgi:hypothetical protein
MPPIVEQDGERNAAVLAAVEAGALDEHGLSRAWEHAPAAETGRGRAAALIAAGAGRRRLSRELEISEYEARQLLARTRTGAPAAGVPGSSPGVDAHTEDVAAVRPFATNGAGGPR